MLAASTFLSQQAVGGQRIFFYASRKQINEKKQFTITTWSPEEITAFVDSKSLMLTFSRLMVSYD